MRPSKTSALFNMKKKVFFLGHTTFLTLIKSMLTASRIMSVVVPKTLYISSQPASQIDFCNNYFKIYRTHHQTKN